VDQIQNGPNFDNGDSVLFQRRLREVISERLPGSLPRLENERSPQYRALSWLRANPPTAEELAFKPVAQKYVLAVLYFSTNGDRWLNSTGWFTNNNECEWFSTATSGSYCDNLGRVTSIDLASNNLVGTIPSELVLLSENINFVRFEGNTLMGGLPSVLRAMTSLERFHVHRNFLSGMLPTDLGGLSQLRSLRLGQNRFLGTIPWQLSELQRLEVLDLNENELTGTIPWGLGDMTSLGTYAFQ
jgi:hypothetical protein